MPIAGRVPVIDGRDPVHASAGCEIVNRQVLVNQELPDQHVVTRGIELDCQAVDAAVSLPFHDGYTEGLSTKAKLIKRHMHGCADFALLLHRNLLG